MANGFGIARNFRPRSFPRFREYNTLMQVASPIPDEVLYGPAGPGGQRVERWMAGIDFDPILAVTPTCASFDCEDDDDEFSANENDETAPSPWNPVEIRTGVRCSTIGLDAAELKDRLEAALRAKESAKLTSLLLGPPEDGGCWPNLTIAGAGEGQARTVGGGQIYAIDEAVARLEDTLAGLDVFGDALGTIFMPPGMMGMLHNRGGLVFENDRWYTPSGTSIVADGGVTGLGPDVEGGDDDSEAGADNDFQWIYATGPVYAHLGPRTLTPDPFADIDGDGIPRVLPRNVMTILSRRWAVALVDPTYRYRIPAAYAASVFVG